MDQTIFCAPKRQAVGSNPAGRAKKDEGFAMEVFVLFVVPRCYSSST